MATRWLTLAQADPGLACQADQLAPRCLIKPGVRRMGNVLLHHGGIDGDPLEIIVFYHPGTLPGLDRLGQQPLDAFLADPVAPACEGRRVNRQPMLKECLTAEMLPIRVLGPSRHDRLVGQGKSVLKIEQPRHQPRRRCRSAGVRRKEPDPFPIKGAPVNQFSKPHQLMAHVDHLDQSGAEEIILLPGRRSGLHVMARICKVSIARIQNLASPAQQNRHFAKIIQMDESCSARTYWSDRHGVFERHSTLGVAR